MSCARRALPGARHVQQSTNVSVQSQVFLAANIEAIHMYELIEPESFA